MATMDFALARFNHQVWKIRLKSFIDGREEMDQSEAVSHKDCDLGKWIYAEGLTKFGDMAEMTQLEQAHADLHKTVSAIVRLKNSGEVGQAQQELTKIGPLSEQVIALLTAIERKVV